ncbi:restriction endonuclease subunit S [Erythrobacter sp. GH1-10]|uniref:restriction endonuclease subunit S n=1 Tax=Erythrobacter sp. GH1-10 TaxID=3349334 RepID=UPI003877D03C
MPDGWRWEPLGAVVRQSKEKLQPDPASKLPFVGLDAIEPHTTSLTSTVPFASMRSSANRFRAGNVLYGRLRPYLNKVWLADQDGACSGEFIVFETREDVDPDYLKWLLHHSRFVDFTSHAVTGDRPRIDLARMSPYPFPLPPLETQKRIVARIDELFTELDDGEAGLERITDDIETYRKSLLKAAMAGELTADWRATNPLQQNGEQLLRQILAERKTRWDRDPKNRKKKYKEPEAADTSELVDLPDGWAWASFSQLCDVRSDGGLKLKERDYLVEGKFKVIDQGAKDVAGYTDDETLLQMVDQPLILFGDHTRRFKPVSEPFCIGADGIKIIAPHPMVDARYMLHAFRAAHFEDRGYSRHFQFVRALALPLPPLHEQRQIALLLDALFEEAGDFALKGEDAASMSRILRHSILASAFKGELVQ